jgi:hypothetical protein
MERHAHFQSFILHISLPREKKNLVSGLQIPFSPGAVCKPDKPLDVPRTFGPRIQSLLDGKVDVYNGCKLYLGFIVTYIPNN